MMMPRLLMSSIPTKVALDIRERSELLIFTLTEETRYNLDADYFHVS